MLHESAKVGFSLLKKVACNILSSDLILVTVLYLISE